MDTELTTAFAIGMGVPMIMHRPLFAAVQKKLGAQGMRRINYRGVEVVTGGGVMTVISTAVTLAAMILFLKGSGVDGRVLKEGVLLGAGMLAMAFWGWQDDRSTDQQAKGFRGHIGTLWREKRMTSGMWKLWGGGSTAILISLALTHSFWTWLLQAGLLSLSPNILNLFDLRPTRAIKVFWLLLALCLVVGLCAGQAATGVYHWLWLLPVIASTILLFRHDGCGRIMLGDTGSNALGFAAGYSLVMGMPLKAQAAMLLLFVALQILAEFISFSQVIQRVKWLDRIDAWGRSAEPE